MTTTGFAKLCFLENSVNTNSSIASDLLFCTFVHQPVKLSFSAHLWVQAEIVIIVTSEFDGFWVTCQVLALFEAADADF